MLFTTSRPAVPRMATAAWSAFAQTVAAPVMTATAKGVNAAATTTSAQRSFLRPMSSDHQAIANDWVDNIGRTDYLVGERPDFWWTGKKPVHGVCPGVDENNHIHALPQPDLSNATREGLLDYFDNCWTLTEVIFASLQGEEPFYRPPYHDLRHPKIFYYAHTASVYVNKMRVAGLIPGPVNEYYEHIFETGVDEMQWDDLSKNHMMWPSVEEVRQYRKVVYDMIVDIIKNDEKFDSIKDLQESPMWAIVMGTEHEKIHLETSSVLMRELPLELLRVPENYPPLAPHNNSTAPNVLPVKGQHYPENPMLDVESGVVTIGKPADFPSYGWDNEYGHKEMSVASFKANKFKISNGEFYEFVAE